MAIINGTAGNDRFLYNATPNSGGDIFNMGDGNDIAFANMGPNTYIGGNGIDAVNYFYADVGVTLNLVSGGTVGFATGHTYIGIEKIFGSRFDDSITGSLEDDLLYGGSGNDTLDGSAGNDRIFGQSGNDIINGGDGNDYIEGGAGGDFINGGAGIDTIGFRTSQVGVIADLDAPPPQAEHLNPGPANDALDDFYVNIENISGSLYNDTLRGSEVANFISGRDGNDNIYGDGGNDKLYGGNGDDFISGGDGADYLRGDGGDDTIIGGDGVDRIYLGGGDDYAEGGNGNDFFYLTNDGATDEIYGGNNTNGDGPNTDTGYDTVSYFQATAGVEVYLGGFIIVGPPPPANAEPFDNSLNMTVIEDDFLVGIERVIGSNFNDAIFGGFGNEVIIGGNGDDVLEGGAGRDRLIGGNGADEFGFFIGGSDVDAILDFEQGIDTITFITTDESLTESDILATIMDYGTNFVFEFGFGDGPVAQRLSVIKGDPDQVLTVDDFTILLFEGTPFDPPPPDTQQPLAENFDSYDFTQNPAAFFDADALI